MQSINVTDGVHEQISLLARAWDISEAEVVRRLLEEFTKASHRSKDVSPPSMEGGVPIYAVYDGNRIDAVYHPSTKRIDITTGVLAGRSFKSPSGAAIAVVRAHKPNIHPNRNGWYFWVVTDTGKVLESIR